MIKYFVSSLVAAIALAQNPVTMDKLGTPEKALRFQVIVPAPLDQVWNAFTTKAGLETWLWRDCRVDLRAGGDWIAQYTPSATGGGTIVSLVPLHEVVMRAMAPEQFPTVRQERTTATFRFEAMDAKFTRVTLLQTGWKQGAEWDRAYEYLSKGNAQLLEQLYRRFVSGPVQWPAR